MKLFETPAIEVITFTAEDILTESVTPPDVENGLGWG